MLTFSQAFVHIVVSTLGLIHKPRVTQSRKIIYFSTLYIVTQEFTKGDIHIHKINIFNGSNTFETMKLCSRHGQFKLMSVNHSARSAGIIWIFFFDFL